LKRNKKGRYTKVRLFSQFVDFTTYMLKTKWVNIWSLTREEINSKDAKMFAGNFKAHHLMNVQFLEN
jgi:hypothetical protein